MKIKKLNKMLATIMLVLMLFSVIQPVFAASGSGTWSGGQYASGMKTTDNAGGTTGVLIRRLNNLSTGERRTVFCAEHGIDFKTGATYNGVYYTPTDSNIRKACKVAYLGWYKNNGGYTVDGGILASDMKWVKWDYVFTQQYIWEILGQSNATFINADEQQGYVDFKNRINSEIARIETRPSFNGTTITIQAGENKTINDSNGVLAEYGDGANPVILKSEFILSLCEQLIGSVNLGPKQKSIIDRCTASVYRIFQQGNYQGIPPTLQDFREELLKQTEPEAKEIALAIELFTNGSLNTFAMNTNVNTSSSLICYDILDLGKQLLPIGMLVVLDSILNRITANRTKGKNTYIFIDEIYLLFQYEYSANFLFTLWKRVRKYGAFCTGITQNVEDLLQSHTARTMLANSEFIIMLNQASTDRIELAKLLNISDLQMSYITNVGAGEGLIKVGSSLVPFVNKFPKNTELYKLMTTKPGEGLNE